MKDSNHQGAPQIKAQARLQVLANHLNGSDCVSSTSETLSTFVSSASCLNQNETSPSERNKVPIPNVREAEYEELEPQLVFNKTLNEWELSPIEKQLSFDQGMFQTATAIQKFKQKKKDKIICVGVAGPPGAGKSTLSNKLASMFNGLVLPLEHFVKVPKGLEINFDDVFMFDFGLLVNTVKTLKQGNSMEIPRVSFSRKQRIGTQTVSPPPGRVIIVDGAYALNPAIRSFLDVTVAIDGGVHMDLMKRIVRDVSRSTTPKKEAILDITHVVFPMYKVYIEPDMKSAKIKIYSTFNPMLDIGDPIYVCKAKEKYVNSFLKELKQLSHQHNYDKPVKTKNFQDIYLYPPRYDPRSPGSSDRTNWIRIRSSDGLWYIQFYNEIIDPAVNVRPTLNFEISVRTLAGLLSLGYQIGATMHRKTEIFYEQNSVQITRETIKELNKTYIQIKGSNRHRVLETAQKLSINTHHIPQSFLYLYFRKLKNRNNSKKKKAKKDKTKDKNENNDKDEEIGDSN